MFTKEDQMESDRNGSTGTHDDAGELLEPALFGTGLVFAAVGSEPFSGRSVLHPRRARVRRLETLRTTGDGA
jgi:hypothetical protein